MSREKTYSEEAMATAVFAVKSRGFRVARAAREFSVPRKTLDDRVKGKISLTAERGRPKSLSEDEEDALKEYLLYMSSHGFPFTRYSDLESKRYI